MLGFHTGEYCRIEFEFIFENPNEIQISFLLSLFPSGRIQPSACSCANRASARLPLRAARSASRGPACAISLASVPLAPLLLPCGPDPTYQPIPTHRLPHPPSRSCCLFLFLSPRKQQKTLESLLLQQTPIATPP